MGALSIHAKGTIKAIKIALTINAPDQPTFCNNNKVDGNMINCPNEPAALAIPIARLRFSGGAARPTAESNTGNDVAERANPKIKPTLKFSNNPVELTAMSNKPSAYSAPPTATTILLPYLSAKAPVMGWTAPQIRFCMAMAKLKTLCPQPNSWLIGTKYKPNACRTPSDNAKIMALPINI